MTRGRLLHGALAATLALTAWAALQPEDEAPAVVQPAAPQRRPAAAAGATLEVPLTPRPAPPFARPHWPEPPPQAVLAWGVPPLPPQEAALPPAAPAAPPTPPFPYRWIGRLDDGTQPVALLAGPQRAVGVRAGDVLDGQWRVEHVQDVRVRLTWLPTGASLNVDLR